jgi:hypothetical protein
VLSSNSFVCPRGDILLIPLGSEANMQPRIVTLSSTTQTWYPAALLAPNTTVIYSNAAGSSQTKPTSRKTATLTPAATLHRSTVTVTTYSTPTTTPLAEMSKGTRPLWVLDARRPDLERVAAERGLHADRPQHLRQGPLGYRHVFPPAEADRLVRVLPRSASRATRANPPEIKAYIGWEDVVDVIVDSISMFGQSGQTGAKGTVECWDNKGRLRTVDWGLY